MGKRDGVLAPLEGQSSTLFLAGGVVLLGFAGGLAVQAFANRPAPEDVFAGAGFALAFLGLLGLYPNLVDRSPWLARAGAVCAALGAVGFAVTFVTSLGQFAGVVPRENPLSALAVLNLVGLVPGYLLFGIANLRTGVHSRTLGFLLLAPAVVFLLNFPAVMLLNVENPQFTVGPFVLSSAQTLVMLATGYVLRTEGTPTDRAESSADATV